MIKVDNLALCSVDGELLSGGFTTPITVTPAARVGNNCAIEFQTVGPFFPFENVMISNNLRGVNFRPGDTLSLPSNFQTGNGEQFMATVKTLVPQTTTGMINEFSDIKGYTSKAPDPDSTVFGKDIREVAAGGGLIITSSSPTLPSGVSINIYTGPSFYLVNGLIKNGGLGYKPNEVVYFSSTSPAFTISVVVSKVGPTGNVIEIFPIQTRLDAALTSAVTITSNSIGSGATLSVTAINKQYQATIITGGDHYYTGETLYIPGTSLNGVSPENDMTVTIRQAGTGRITGVSTVNGNPFTTTFNNIPVRNIHQKVGTGATLDIIKVDYRTIRFSSDLRLIPDIREDYYTRNISKYGRDPIIYNGSGYSLGNILEIPAGTRDVNGDRLSSNRLISVVGTDINGEMLLTSIMGIPYSIIDLHASLIDCKPKIFRDHLKILLTNRIPTILLNTTTFEYSNFLNRTQNFYSFQDTVHIPGNLVGGTILNNDIECMVSRENYFGANTTYGEINVPILSGVNMTANRYKTGRSPLYPGGIGSGIGLRVDVFATTLTNNYGISISKGKGAIFNIIEFFNGGNGGKDTTFSLDLASPGLGYVAGDVLTILGGDIGGIDGEDDLTCVLDSANIDTSSGAAYGALDTTSDFSFTGVATLSIPVAGGSGTGASLKINNKTGTGGAEGCTINFATGAIISGGSGYRVGNIIGGAGIAPNFLCDVMDVTENGTILEIGNIVGLTPSQSGATVVATYPYSAWTNYTLSGGRGLSISYDETNTGNEFKVENAGEDYCYNEIITIFGTDIGSGWPNIYLTVTGINKTNVVGVTPYTTAQNSIFPSTTFPSTKAYSSNAQGCKLTLSYSGSSWNATIVDGGIGYVLGDVLTCDKFPSLTVAITSVSDPDVNGFGGGIIQGVTVTGARIPGFVQGSTTTTTSNYGKNTNTGDVYKIDGAILGGLSGLNDLEIIFNGESPQEFNTVTYRQTNGQSAIFGAASAPLAMGRYTAQYVRTLTINGNYSEPTPRNPVNGGRLIFNVAASNFSISKPGIDYNIGDTITLFGGIVGDLNNNTTFIVTDLRYIRTNLQNILDYPPNNGYTTLQEYIPTRLHYGNIKSIVQIEGPASQALTYGPLLSFNTITSGNGNSCTLYVFPPSKKIFVLDGGIGYAVGDTLSFTPEIADSSLNNTDPQIKQKIIITSVKQGGHVSEISAQDLAAVPAIQVRSFTNLSGNGKILNSNHGFGYNVGDVLTIPGSTLFSTPAVSAMNDLSVNVLNTVSGVITELLLVGTTPSAPISKLFKDIIPLSYPRGHCVLNIKATQYFFWASLPPTGSPQRVYLRTLDQLQWLRNSGSVDVPPVGTLLGTPKSSEITEVTIDDPGNNYPPSSTIQLLVSGQSLYPMGGKSPENDLIFTATTDADGKVITVTYTSGTAPPFYYNSQPTDPTANDVSITTTSTTTSVSRTSRNGFYCNFTTDASSKYVVTIPAGGTGTGYVVGDILTYYPIVTGYRSGGSNYQGDGYTQVEGITKLTMTVKTISGTGAVTEVTNVQGIGHASGETKVAYPIPIGSDLVVDIDFTSATPTIILKNGGSGYEIGDIVTIEGQSIGARETDGTIYDLTYRVQTVKNGIVTALTTPIGEPEPTDQTLALTYTNPNARGLFVDLVGSFPRPGIVGTQSREFLLGDVITIPATHPITSESQWGGKSPQNDLTFTVTAVENSTSGITSLGEITGLPFGDYSKIKFKIPDQIRNIVYMEWTNCTGIIKPCLVEIEEFIDRSTTNGRSTYWRYVTPGEQNTYPDHMQLKLMYPETYSYFTISLLDLTGTPIKQRSNWILEVVIYS